MLLSISVIMINICLVVNIIENKELFLMIYGECL